METIARKLIEKAYGAKNLIYETYFHLSGNKAVAFVDIDTGEIYIVIRRNRRKSYALYELHKGDPRYYSFKAAEEALNDL
jgi:hypothetical protein